MPLLYNDPEHWRERARDARTLAEQITDEIGRQAMLEIAEKYEYLAARAVQRLIARAEKAE